MAATVDENDYKKNPELFLNVLNEIPNEIAAGVSDDDIRRTLPTLMVGKNSKEIINQFRAQILYVTNKINVALKSSELLDKLEELGELEEKSDKDVVAVRAVTGDPNIEILKKNALYQKRKKLQSLVEAEKKESQRLKNEVLKAREQHEQLIKTLTKN